MQQEMGGRNSQQNDVESEFAPVQANFASPPVFYPPDLISCDSIMKSKMFRQQVQPCWNRFEHAILEPTGF